MAVSSLLQPRTMSFTENQSCFILEKLWSQRESGRFCDVVFHVQGQKFQAHRNVLAACSPYFDSVLKMHKTMKEQLAVTCQNVEAFRLLLNYLYTGTVVIDKNNVTELLRLANHFLVAKLKSYCAEYLDRHLDSSNCLIAKEMGDKYNLPLLRKNANVFIQNHFGEIFEQNEILEFNLQKLEEFLMEKQFSIPQHNLLRFIPHWIGHDTSKRLGHFRTLLTFVRWDSIERTYLEDHMRNEHLYHSNPNCMYLLLSCLQENNIDIPAYSSVYSGLKAQFGPGGTKLDSDSFFDIAISAAIQGLQQLPLSSAVSEDNSFVTVAPLEKDLFKTERSCDLVMETDDQSSDPQSSKSSDDADVGFDGSSDTTTTPVTTSRGRVIHQPLKLRATDLPPRNECELTELLQRTWVMLRMEDVQYPVESVTSRQRAMTAQKVSRMIAIAYRRGTKKKSSRQRKLFSSSKLVYKRPVGRPPKRRYITGSETEEESRKGCASDTDSSMHESVNGQSNSCWKDGVKCPHCSYIAHSSIRLEQHVSRIHSKDVTYKCKICEFTCKWNREYYAHMKTHFHGPPFRCEQCDYTCDRIQFLLSHRMRHTDERPFKCDECDHRCRTKANLDCHMRMHTGEKPYQCEHCERRFAIKASLDQHLASHRDDRPYLCDICGFSTKYQSHLFSHKRIHSGDVFRCQFPNCKYSTPKKSQLGAHHRTHTAVRSHICSVCGRAFIEKSHLVRHERIHLNEKPFKCEHCDYCSSRRDKLKEHFRKHHGENATAKGPYRPRKPRRQTFDPNTMYPPKLLQPEVENQHQSQHLELQVATPVISSSGPPAPPPLVYSYDTPHQESIHNHAAVALQQLGAAAAAHNYQVTFMEPRHPQSLHSHHQQSHSHTNVGPPPPPNAVTSIMSDQNRVNVVTVNTHDGNNIVAQPPEFSPFMQFM